MRAEAVWRFASAMTLAAALAFVQPAFSDDHDEFDEFPPPDVTSTATVAGYVPFPEPKVLEDLIQTACSFEYPTDSDVGAEGLNLRGACERCEEMEQECWIRNINAGGLNEIWQVSCLEAGLTGLQASLRLEILCGLIPRAFFEDLCRRIPELVPARRVRRIAVCVPATNDLTPRDLSFDYKRCGTIGPWPESACCRQECDYGTPVIGDRGDCICSGTPPLREPPN